MKNVNFFIVALFVFFSSISHIFSQDLEKQEEGNGKWLIKIGTHSINYYPITSPFDGFFLKKNNSFDPTISSLGLEHKIKKNIGLYVDGSVGFVNNNRWDIEDCFFVKLSHGVNLYIFPYHKFDPYVRLGAGYHKFNEYLQRDLRISDTKYFKTNRKDFFVLDGGLGLNFWIVPNLGINVQSTYNQVFAYQSRDYLNFWKHNVGVVLRFGNLKFVENDKYDQNWRNRNRKIINKDRPRIPTPFISEKSEKEKKEEDKICCHKQYQQKEFKDSDNDGVLDKEDLCPNQFGLKKFKGCPDTDFDNIPDHEDKCPNKFGKKENKGCPDIVFSPILFDVGKFGLSHRSLVIINEIAKIMINNLPNSKFYVDGYTDIHGKLFYNKILSLKRANSVFEALVSKGVDPSRIEIRGLVGGKKKGRRVEITIRKFLN
ncbi:OmpA family protein [Blattabacterium cuenoti]|uniref:OmpA family protein n=1 Tax=Blattabacterium cuenoti TaxID=1653831 RepID=UPI00163C05E7|nr:OmpA family protein [Blattabacterium cuenoti]